MRGGRRAMMAQRKVLWQAEDGVLPTAKGWQLFDSRPAEDGVWEEKNGEAALKYVIPVHGQHYRFFLPDTLRSQSAIELDFSVTGTSLSSLYPTISLWLPGEMTAGFSGATVVVRTGLVALFSNNGLPGHAPAGSASGVRNRLRVERRQEEVRTFINGYECATQSAISNYARTNFVIDYPAGAPNQSCLLLTVSPTTAAHTVWLYRLLWEEV